MRDARRYATDAALLVTGSALGCAFAVLAKSSVVVDGTYLPFGNDAFYHARRILDVVNSGALLQFDPLMHLPEGGWVPWPWGFDRLMAVIVQIATSLSPGTNPMQVLIYVPVFWLPVNLGLMLGVFKTIGLRAEFSALGIAGFALSPLTQRLHGIGVIDHHFMELTFVLLVALLLLRWMARPDSISRAIACGVSLGLAQAFHHGLFILQLPVLGTLFILWLRSRLPSVAVRALAAAVLAATVLLALPSESLRDGQFSMATFSWFHVYIALCTAILLGAMSFKPFATKSLFGVALLALVLGVPASAEALLGTRFLTGQLAMLDQIIETASPLGMITGSWGFNATIGLYSGLLLLAPLSLLASVHLSATDRQPLPIAFGVFSIFGLGLLLLQYRLNYFGLCFLLAGPFYFLARYLTTDKRALVFLGALAVFALAYRPPLSGPLFQQHSIAADHLYEATRPLYPILEEACKEEPGIVAASSQFGHYIRFHTNCGVIANNFLLTEQHFEKVQLANSLFHLPADALTTQVPGVRYVLAFLADTYEQREGNVYLRDMTDIRGRNPRLINQLMLADRRSDDFEVLHEVFVDPEADPKIPLAGIYRIRR